MPPSTALAVQTETTKVEKRLKLPGWAWAVIIIITVLVLSAAVVVPVVLTLTTKSGGATPSVSVTPTTTHLPTPEPPRVNSAAIIFQNQLPAMDSLAKYRAQIADVRNNSISTYLIGRGSKTGFYVTDTLTGVTPAPTIFNPESSALTTTGSGSGLESTLAVYQSLPTTNYYTCTATFDPANLSCVVQSWPQLTVVDSAVTFHSLWRNVAQQVMCSLYNQGNTVRFSAQSTAAVFSAQDQVVPDLQTPAEDTVVRFCGSFNQPVQTVVWAGRFNNRVYYLDMATPTTTPAKLNVIEADKDETLLDVDVTADGLLLVVLTNKRLILYARKTQTPGLPFKVSDQVGVPKSAEVRNVAIDTASSDSVGLWVAVGRGQPYLNLYFVRASTTLFVPSLARELVVPQLVNTAAVNLVRSPSSTNTFVLATDTGGAYAVTWLVTAAM